MEFKTLSLGLFSIFAFVLLIGFASAVVDPVNVQGNSSSINHGDSFEVKFYINNTHATNTVVNMTLTLPSLSSSGSWKSAKVGSKTYSISSNKVALTDLSIANLTKSEQFVLKFTSNKQVAPGNYAGDIVISAKYNETGGTPSIDNIKVSMEIKSSPSFTLTSTQSITDLQSGKINVSNNGNVDFSDVNLTASGDFNVSFSSNNFALNKGSSNEITITPTTNISSLTVGTYDLKIKVNASDTLKELSYTVKRNFCVLGEKGTSTLTIESINIDSSGGDDDKWKPLDEITIDVDIENDGDDSIKKIIVELGLFDSKGKNQVDDLDFENDDEEEIDYGTLRDDEKDRVTFRFTIPADFDEDDYNLAIKVYSDDEKESNLCKSTSDDLDKDFYQEIEVEREDDKDKLIVVNNIQLTPEKATPGDRVTITFDIWNVGDDDEDKVKVNIESSVLGIDSEKIIKNLNDGKGEEFEVSFTVPNIKDGDYKIEFSTEYDYSSSKGTYRQTSTIYRATLEIFGSSVIDTTTFVDVTAKLADNSDPKAGEEMIVKTTIKNTGDASAAFVITIKDLDSWATLSSISDSSFTLDKGASKDVELKIKVKDDISGTNSFKIETTSGGKVDIRDVSVSVEGKSSVFGPLASLTQGNNFIWLVAIINVILILLIIVVAVSLSRR